MVLCCALLSWTLRAALFTSASCVVTLTLLFAVFRALRNRTHAAFESFPGHFEELPLARHVVHMRSFLHSARVTGLPFGVFLTEATCGYIRARQLQKQGAHVEYIAGMPTLLIYRSDHVAELLTHGSNIRKSFLYDFLHAWLGESLLLSTGPRWRSHRKMLTPAFHFKILEQFASVMNRQARVFVGRIRDRPNGEDLTPYISALLLDVICETIMGTSMGCQSSDKGAKYLHGIHRLCELFIHRMQNVFHWSDFVYGFTDAHREFHGILADVHSFTQKVIEERKAELLRDADFLSRSEPDATAELFAKSKKPFLDLMLYSHLNGELSVEDMRGEVDTFMFAGHDTSSMALTFTVYLIGLHPDVQQKLHDEVDRVFASDDADCDVTSEHIRELPYLDMVFRESQRLLPSVPIVGRHLDQPMEIDGRTIPKGTTVNVVLASLHTDPNVFPKPDEFIPERFTAEECEKRSSFAYLPFSAGPRNCIGQKFALLQVKIMLVWLLRRYRWRSLDPRDRIHLVFEVVQKLKCKLRIDFRERHK